VKNKAYLIEKIADNTGLSKNAAAVAFNTIFSEITKALAKGETVNVSSFGKFEVRTRAARKGVSPRDPKKEIRIPAVKVARFRAGKGLKQSVR
jgi:DNA-binding protein HU-beta